MRRAALFGTVTVLLLSTMAPAQAPPPGDPAAARQASSGPRSHLDHRQINSIDAPAMISDRPGRTPIRRVQQDVPASNATRSMALPWTTLGGLVLILATIAVLGRLARTFVRRPTTHADGMVDVLGRIVLDRVSTLYIVRIGQRVLVIGASPAGLRTLTEINEPIEMQQFMALGATLATSFRSFPEGATSSVGARPRGHGLPGQTPPERAVRHAAPLRAEAAHG